MAITETDCVCIVGSNGLENKYGSMFKKNGHYNDLEVKHSRLLDDRVISVQLINSALHLLEVVF